jgi:molybdopterin converting factor small subunit
MHVRFELTARLAELAGFRDESLDVAGDTLDDALLALEERLAGSLLVDEGRLHSSVLVVLDGEVFRRGQRRVALRGDETVHLMLPVAGG